MTDFLRNLLTAQVDRFPTSVLVHKFWLFFSNWHHQAKNFTACLKRHNLGRVKCFGITTRYCGMKFAEKSAERMEQCRRLITNEINVTAAGLEPRAQKLFADYHSCFQTYRRRVDANCTDLLRQAIAGPRVRAAKVVRATMNSMRPLLSALPELRIIHLIRDPRAVALSRLRFSPSVRGAYTRQSGNRSQQSSVSEATLYCHHVTADIRARKALEREFPGRVMQMRYEDVIADPEQKFRDIYTLLDEPAPIKTLRRMTGMASKGQKRNLTTKWQKALKLSDQKEIAQRCSDFFRLLGISADQFSNSLSTRQ